MLPSQALIGSPVRRREDPRLLRGQGRYVADIVLPNQLSAALVRSPHAHARIAGIDVSRARAMTGVLAVFIATDLADTVRPLPVLVPHPALREIPQPLLAADLVRYVGQPVAMVVAESRYLAEDAAEAVEVEYNPLPAVDLDRALSPEAPRLHDALPDNCAVTLRLEGGDVEAAFAAAYLVVDEEFRISRGAAQPMETRGVLAAWDAVAGNLMVWSSTQHPHTVRRVIAACLGMSEDRVRVKVPEMGGGFGCKVLVYPEEVLVVHAARVLGRPVQWVEDRREHFVATAHERGQIHRARLAVARDGTILGLEDTFLHDCGAYTPYGVGLPLVTASTLPGPYRVPNCRIELKAVYTTAVPVAPYRGAGRPQATFVMNRLLDAAAARLGMDPLDIRRRNLITRAEMPYDTGITNQYRTRAVYDSADVPRAFEMAVEAIGHAQFRAEQARARAQGRCLGIGVVPFMESTAGGPYEGARVSIEPSGRVAVASGATPHGQGHETVLAQVCAEVLDVPVDQVDVLTGDTAAIPFGIGTYGSRTAVLAGNAVYLASEAVKERARALAARLLEAHPDDLELANGGVQVRGSPGRRIGYAALAKAADPLRGSLPGLDDPGLRATHYFQPPDLTYASGVHAVIVEVDPATGTVRILRYAVVHDCGRILNPMIVEGQAHGGVAQGIGGVLYENLVYDGDGQMLTATFMDYLLPTAMEVPPAIHVGHVETLSPRNPLGIKGAGEGGIIPVTAAVVQAVEDALRPFGARLLLAPLTPEIIMRAIRR